MNNHITEYYKQQLINDRFNKFGAHLGATYFRDNSCGKHLRDKYFEKERCMDTPKPIKYILPYDSEGNLLPQYKNGGVILPVYDVYGEKIDYSKERIIKK